MVVRHPARGEFPAVVGPRVWEGGGCGELPDFYNRGQCQRGADGHSRNATPLNFPGVFASGSLLKTGALARAATTSDKVLFRASGTEPLLRIYTEGASPALVKDILGAAEAFVKTS